MFLVAVGFWNFVGAGIFGFLINLPIVSYYQIGTALTANHAHGAMMGVYGMLAVGLALFALRYIIPPQRWPDKLAKLSFWSLNIGLAWMVFATLLPLGVLQLWHSVNDGYYEARTLGYITQPGNVVLEWLRMPGDFVFILGGVLPFLWIAWLGVRYGIKATTHTLPAETLFVEEHPEAEEDRTGLAVTGGGRPSRYASDRRPAPDDGDDRGRIRDRGHRDRRVADDRIRRAARGSSHTASTRSPGAPRPRWSDTGRVAFVYHEDHDAWLCPEDQWLWPKSFDPDNRVMRYRGSPSICNACPVKQTLHHLKRRPRGEPGDRQLAGVGGGALPPRDRVRGQSSSRSSGRWPWRIAAETAPEALLLVGCAVAVGAGVAAAVVAPAPHPGRTRRGGVPVAR